MIAGRVLVTLLQWVEARPLAGNPEPSYPEEALRQSVAGEVTFRVAVSAEGDVEDVFIVEVPDPLLGFGEAVMTAVRQWRFEPARRDGEVVGSYYLGRAPFSIRPEAEEALRRQLERGLAEWVHPSSAILDRGRVFRGENGARQWLERTTVGREAGDEIRKIVFSPGAHATLFLRNGAELSVLKSGNEWLLVSWISAGDDAIELPETLEAPPPTYPRDGPQTGVVVLQALIDQEGFVRDLEVVGSVPELDAYALAAVRKWRFQPARRRGFDVPIVMTLTVFFE
jgi:TonB family protein